MTSIKPTTTLKILAAGVAGFSIPVSTAGVNFGALFLLLIALATGRRPEWSIALRQPVLRACLALYALFLLGALYTSTPDQAPRMLAKMYPYLFAPFFFVACLDRVVRRSVLIGFVVAAILTLVLSVGSWAVGRPVALGIPGNWYVFRTHTYHNLFVSWLVIAMLVLLLSGRVDGWARKAVAAIIAVGVYDVMFLVQGRTGHVLLVMMALLVLLLWDRRKGLAVGAMILFVGLPAVWLGSDVIRERFSAAAQETEHFSNNGGQETSVGLRLSWAKDTAAMVMNRPFTGYGTGSFETEFRRAHGVSLNLAEKQPPLLGTSNPHNDYLWFAAELGLPGVLVLLSVFVAAIWQAGNLPREQQWMVRAVVLAIAVGSLMNSFITDNITGTGYIVLLMALLAGPLRESRLGDGGSHA